MCGSGAPEAGGQRRAVGDGGRHARLSPVTSARSGTGVPTAQQ